MSTKSEQSITSKVMNHFGNSRASWVILLGAALFVVPEPITSFVGVAVMAGGLGLWILEKLL